VKINATDFQPGGFDIDDSAHAVGLLDSKGFDLIEISGAPTSPARGVVEVRFGSDSRGC